jgi:glutathione peroxidase-family protein
VHSPEYSHEKDSRLLRQRMKRLGIEYPVAQDNELATFESWAVKVWPTSYLIDRDGNIVLRHVGEGHYDEMEAQIRTLLGL